MALNFNNLNFVPTEYPSALDYFASHPGLHIYITRTNGDVYISRDLRNDAWTYVTSFAQNLNSGTLLWSQSNNAFMFFNYDSGEVYISTDDGSTWTSHQTGVGPPLFFAFMTVSDIFITDGEFIFQSSDGINFSNVGSLPSKPTTIYGAAFNGQSNVVLVGYPGWIVYSNDGGFSWFASTGYDTGGTISYINIAYGNGIFIVVGHDEYGSNRTYQSTDGVAWTSISMPPFAYTIAFGNQTFLLNCDGILYNGSGDGTWTPCNNSVLDQFTNVFYSSHEASFLLPANADSPIISDTLFKYNEPYDITAYEGTDFGLAPSFQPHTDGHKLNMQYANAIVLGTFTTDTVFSFITPPNVNPVEGYTTASFSLLPLELVVFNLATNHVSLSWIPYSNDSYNIILDGYTVQSGVHGNAASISNLTPLTQYTVRVLDTTTNVYSQQETFTTLSLSQPSRLITSTTNGQFIIPNGFLTPLTSYTRMFALENIRIVFKTSANPIESFIVHFGEQQADIATFPYQSAITNYSAVIQSNTIGTAIQEPYTNPNISVYLQYVSSIDGQIHELNSFYQCTASFVFYDYQA
jgi:hypothetical protein